MQQFTRDFAQALRTIPEMHVRTCIASTTGGLFLFPFVMCARGIVAALRGQCVHLGDGALAPLGVMIKTCVPSARVTVTVHGLDLIYPRWWYRSVIPWCLRRLDRIVCVSTATQRQLRRRGVAPDRTVVIPCGIWPEEEPVQMREHRGKAPALVTVGRLTPRKGVAWFVREVLPILCREFPGLTYRIAGTGRDERLIKNIIQRDGLEGTVQLLGQITDTQRNALIRGGDVFVMPNVPTEGDMEGFGVSCIEATLRGTPVAAACVDGVPDAVREGETGLLFLSGDSSDAAKCIQSLLRNPLPRGRVAAATRSGYSWHDLVRYYERDVFTA